MIKQLDALANKLESVQLGETEQTIREAGYMLDELLGGSLEDSAQGGLEFASVFETRMLQTKCTSLVNKLQRSRIELANIIRDIHQLSRENNK